jgi:predicted nucleic acid-binding Zn ribbon protein
MVIQKRVRFLMLLSTALLALAVLLSAGLAGAAG